MTGAPENRLFKVLFDHRLVSYRFVNTLVTMFCDIGDFGWA